MKRSIRQSHLHANTPGQQAVIKDNNDSMNDNNDGMKIFGHSHVNFDSLYQVEMSSPVHGDQLLLQVPINDHSVH